MSGVLEQMHAAVQAAQADIVALKQELAALKASAGTVSAATPAAGGFGGLGGFATQAPQLAPAPVQQAAPAQVTEQMLTDLIMPVVSNPAIKDALGAAMRQLGVNALPEARPDQYPALYAAFQAVIAQHSGGGAAPAAQPSSII